MIGRRGTLALICAATAIAASCTLTGRPRDVALVDCAEAVGVRPPINFTWIDRVAPGGSYVWAPGTEVTPAQQDLIDECMATIADRPIPRAPAPMR
jgi:hypothetical protein